MVTFWTRLTGCDKKLQYVVTMRVLGGLLLFLGAAEMSLGLYIFSYFKNVHLGGWWGAICVIVSGLLGIASNNRSVVMGGCAVSSFGLITAAVAVVLDGLSVALFKGLVACANTETRVYSGSESAVKEIKSCAKDYMHSTGSGSGSSRPHVFSFLFNSTRLDAPHDPTDDYSYSYYYSLESLFNYNNESSRPYYNTDDDFVVGGPGHYNNNNNHHHHNDDDDGFVVQPICVCTDNSACYEYSLAHGSDCGLILSTYTNDLVSSTSLLAVSFFVLLIYCVVAFSSACFSEYKIAAGSDEVQLTSLAQHRDLSPPSPPTPGPMTQSPVIRGSMRGNGNVRYAVPYVVQRTPPSGHMVAGSPQSPGRVPQYVQMGSQERPVYILQMYAPNPGQAAPTSGPVFLDAPQFVAMNSDSHMYLSHESSFRTGS